MIQENINQKVEAFPTRAILMGKACSLLMMPKRDNELLNGWRDFEPQEFLSISEHNAILEAERARSAKLVDALKNIYEYNSSSDSWESNKAQQTLAEYRGEE